MIKNVPQMNIGVDVSKNYLDIFMHPTGKRYRIENNKIAINSFLRSVKGCNVNQLACEASGGYEHLILSLSKRAKLTTWCIDPRRVRAFAQAQGIRAKNDRIDAKIIAMFASENKCKYKQEKTDEQIRLDALVKRKHDLTEAAKQEKQRLANPIQKSHMAHDIEHHIKYLQKRIAKIDDEIAKMINKNNSWRKKADILESMPGIGPKSVETIISQVSEIGQMSNKKIASLVGVAPIIKQSGASKGVAKIRDGRAYVRKMLYMAALSAARYNPDLATFYKRLRLAGKPGKVALVAVTRKMIVTLNAMVRKNEAWTSHVEA